MFGGSIRTVVSLTGKTPVVSVFRKRGTSFVLLEKFEGVSFEELRKRHHIRTVRFLIPEDATYLKVLIFPFGTQLTKELVLKRAEEGIPESLHEEGYVDWKEVSLERSTDIGVQVFVVKKEVLTPLLRAASQAGVDVESVEPPSFAMARVASYIEKPFLLVYPAVNPKYLYAVEKGKVLEVMSVDPLTSLEESKQTFLAYVKATWGVTIGAIATNTPDAVVGLAMKEDLVGSDDAVLNIPLRAPSSKRSSLPIIPVLLFFVVTLLIVGLGFLLIQRTKTKEDRILPQVEVVVPTPLPIVERKTLSIEVQNGSGVPGAAKGVKIMLEELGYGTVTAANADSFTYEGVEVRGKTISIAERVIEDLKVSYGSATASNDLLDSQETKDAIVIVGKE